MKSKKKVIETIIFPENTHPIDRFIAERAYLAKRVNAKVVTVENDVSIVKEIYIKDVYPNSFESIIARIFGRDRRG